MINRLYLLSLIILFVCGTTFANGLTWRNYTNMYDIRDMVLVGDDLWCATNGGIFRFNTTDESFKLFTNLDGLCALDVRSIEADSSGDIWVGTYDGLINLIHLPENEFELIDDFDRHVIYDIAVLNRDSLLIAFDNGIGLYVKSDREVKETYSTLGSEFEPKIQVNCLFVDGKDIWAGTNDGIAKTSLDKINLNDPESWTNHTVNNGLSGQVIKDIQVADDVVFAMTDGGISRFDTTGWTTVRSGIEDNLLSGLNSFFEKSDTLYMATNWGVHRYDPSLEHWYPHRQRKFTQDLGYISRLFIDKYNRIWVGRINIYKTDMEEPSGGLAVYNYPDSVWTAFYPPGPQSNKFVDIDIAPDGTWWFATADRGVLSFDGMEWKEFSSFSMRDNISGFNFNAVEVDPENNVWAGSNGAGLLWITPNDSITMYGKEYLSGPSTSPDYIIVQDVAVDSKNNIWLTNRLAGNNEILVCRTPENEWYKFSKSTNLVSKLEIDSADRIWLCSDEQGLFLFLHNGTLDDKSDDDFEQGFKTVNGLYSNKVTVIKEDLENVMWFGTEEGLNYWDSFLGDSEKVDSFYYPIISPNIATIEVDAQNNVWLGTSAGISKISSYDRFNPENYYSENTPLVNDGVNALRMNNKTGELLIGTNYGLSVLETGLTAPKGTNYSYIQVYPNPFYIGDQENQLHISNLAENSLSVKIHTINGALVKEIPLDDPVKGGFGGQAIWTGTNEDGELVASGVYIIFVYAENGEKHLSKVAVIRE